MLSACLVCPRSLATFYIVNYYMNWGMTSWTYSTTNLAWKKIWVACCTLKKIFAEWWNVYLKKIFPLNTYVLYKCALWTTQSMQSVKDGWSALKLSRFFSLYFSDGWWVRSPCLFSCICYSKMQIVLTQPVCLCKVLTNIMNVSASDKLIALISCLFGLSSVCKAFA